MSPREAHIVPARDGGWEVVVPGDDRAASRHSSQREAAKWARSFLRRSGGGEAVIHGTDGTIRDSDRVESAPIPVKTR